MKIIRTEDRSPDDLDVMEREWCYNALDTMITAEVLDAILPQLDDHTRRTYDFSRELQGPALEMRLRGVMVDKHRKNEVIDDFYEKIDFLERNLERIVLDGAGMPGFNWRSNDDLKALFYDRLKIPEMKRQGRVTVDRNALEKMEAYNVARPIISHIKAMRDLAKKISVLKTEIDHDGRMRTSYNIAGTNTFRFSSSFSEFGTGGNLQNVEESLRSIFISDPGYKFAKFDGAQIQSRIVGAAEWNHIGDATYLDVCESGDLHTAVARMTWPEFKWTGDPKKDKIIAGQLLYRGKTYRDGCKVLGHGTNFDGKAETLSTQTRIPIPLILEFQRKYHKAFPGHIAWKNWTDDQLRKTGTIIAIGGQKRQFWGRRNDPDVLREALAFEGQATEAKIVNSAMLRIWRLTITGPLPIQLMMHDHDALTFQYPEHLEDEIVPKLLELLRWPVALSGGRVLEIPYDAKTGWNKGDWSVGNPEGLRDWRPGDERKRGKEVSFLDRKLR